MLKVQTVAGAAQFTGAPGSGLFLFSEYDRLIRTTRISLARISYHANAPGPGGDRIDIYLAPPTLTPTTERILLGRGLTTAITGPDGSVDFVVCGGLLPRENDGRQWAVVLTSAGKAIDATAVVDFYISPHPEDVR